MVATPRIKVRNSAPASRSTRNYEWGELTPVQVLPNGIAVYDSTSFPSQHDTEIAGTPYQPTLVRVDAFRVESGADLKWKELGPSLVLVMHGDSAENYWRQKASPHTDVETIISEVEAAGLEVDVLAVCNPAGYHLPERGSGARHTYPLQKSKSEGFVLEDDLLRSHITAERVIFKGDRTPHS